MSTLEKVKEKILDSEVFEMVDRNPNFLIYKFDDFEMIKPNHRGHIYMNGYIQSITYPDITLYEFLDGEVFEKLILMKKAQIKAKFFDDKVFLYEKF